MARPLDTSAAHTTCQILKRLVVIAAIAMGSTQTAHAGELFGNVTAALFAPSVVLTSVVDVDDAGEQLIESERPFAAGPEAMPTVVEATQFLSQTPAPLWPEQVQTSLQAQTSTQIDGSDLRNPMLRRPPGLLPLYITFAALQMMDAHSTTKALNNGGVEVNPVMRTIAGNRTALYATKIAVTAATIYIGETFWRKNRFGTIMTMVALNSVYAMVVQHNYGVASR